MSTIIFMVYVHEISRQSLMFSYSDSRRIVKTISINLIKRLFVYLEERFWNPSAVSLDTTQYHIIRVGRSLYFFRRIFFNVFIVTTFCDLFPVFLLSRYQAHNRSQRLALQPFIHLSVCFICLFAHWNGLRSLLHSGINIRWNDRFI